jgi:hypothetical protein
MAPALMMTSFEAETVSVDPSAVRYLTPVAVRS